MLYIAEIYFLITRHGVMLEYAEDDGADDKMMTNVADGVVYERQGAPHLRWEVVATAHIGGIPHVYLQRVGDPTDVRLFSEAAVANRREFRRVGPGIATGWFLEWRNLVRYALMGPDWRYLWRQ